MADNQLPNGDIFKNVRTLEDIINVLSMLYGSLNSLNQNYYDLFVNPTPRDDIEVMGYDENGNITPRKVANVAYYRTSVMSGAGAPTATVEGVLGNFYIDTVTGNLYYNTGQLKNKNEWTRIDDDRTTFLTPEGDGSGLTNLSTDQLVRGILPVERGGSGVNNITGLIKGNDNQPYSAAIDGTDYIGPSMTGVISYFAGDEAPTGWLICDGSLKLKSSYSRLFSVIGNKYKNDGDDTEGDYFRLPNLIDKYIKGGTVAGTTGEAQVGTHSHALTGSTNEENQHTHDRGTYDIRGVAGTSWMSNGKLQNPTYQFTGCFFKIPSKEKPTWTISGGRPVLITDSNAKYYGVNDDSTSNNDPGMGFQAALNWSGRSGSTSHSHTLSGSTAVNAQDTENDVAHITMIPIIKY